MTGVGQASAAGQAAFGQQTGANVSNLYGQQGDAASQAALVGGRANANTYGDIAKSIGTFAGSGIFNNQQPAVTGPGRF